MAIWINLNIFKIFGYNITIISHLPMISKGLVRTPWLTPFFSNGLQSNLGWPRPSQAWKLGSVWNPILRNSVERINDLNTYEHICFVYTVYTVYGVYVNTWCTNVYIYIYYLWCISYISYIRICLRCHLEISGQAGKKKETPSFFPHIVTSSIRILKYIEYPTKFSIWRSYISYPIGDSSVSYSIES